MRWLSGLGRLSSPQMSDFNRLGMGVVPRKGLEPSRPLSHWHLKPARLPIPPPGPGPVSTDRSRACQIGKVNAKYAVQRRGDGVSRNVEIALRDRPNLTGRNGPYGI